MKKTTRKPIDPAIRDAMTEAVKAFGLREMARAVAMSPSGLQKFIDGAEPYPKTRRRLEPWFGSWAGTGEPMRVRAEGVTQVVRSFPQQKQAEVRRALEELVKRFEAPGKRVRKPVR
jgi:hypothetical protein